MGIGFMFVVNFLGTVHIYVMSQHEQYINMIKKIQVSIYTAVLTYTAVVLYTPIEALYVFLSICSFVVP